MEKLSVSYKESSLLKRITAHHLMQPLIFKALVLNGFTSSTSTQHLELVAMPNYLQK
jgi:hypothetical protein